ncbi:MAG: type VI secretion protein [marine bacterium B5-7]|nr:MAG: type VI secretion protein [marine bacterium B5-7]
MLTQQHLQQADRCRKQEKDIWRQWTQPQRFGLSLLRMDETAVHLGKVSVLQVKGVFANGDVFSWDAQHDGDLHCLLNNESKASVIVYLVHANTVLPAGVGGYPEPRSPSWQAEYTEINDVYDSSRQNEVCIAAPIYRLQTEIDEAVQSLPLLRCVRNEQQEWQCDTDFIPPILHVSTSPALMQGFRILKQHVESKLKQARYQSVAHSQRLLQLMWQDKLHRLKHIVRFALSQALITPDTLFNQLSEQAILFDHDYVLPSYDPLSLSEIFSALFSQLNQSLQQLHLPNVTTIPLHTQTPQLFSTGPINTAYFQAYDWYLVLNQAIENKVQQAKQIKIAAGHQIDHIITASVNGVVLTAMQSAPPGVMDSSTQHYFQLTTQGDTWQAIVNEHCLALFFPQAMDEHTVKLIVVPRNAHG